MQRGLDPDPGQGHNAGVARRRARSFVAAAAGLLVLAADAPAERAWEPFRSEVGRFAVRLPGPPEQRRDSHATLAGRVESAEYRVDDGSLELRVELHDVPAVAGWLLSDGALLARAQQDLLADDRAREARDESAEVQGHPARRVRYRLGGGDGRDGRALLVLVGARLYILAALHPPHVEADAALDRFFGSFEVWR